MQGFHPSSKHKQKPQNYANGGMVRGPGTGTSDDVPAMIPKGGYVMPADSTQALGFQPGSRPANLSNGEMVLNPEQVQQAGGFQALDAMRQATHTPAPDQNAPGKPKFFFANGGAEDEAKRLREAAMRNVNKDMAPNTPSPWVNGTPPAGFISKDAQTQAMVNQIPTDGYPQRAPAAPQARPAAPQPQTLDPQAQADRAAIGGAWDAAKGFSQDAGRAIADVATAIPRGLAGAYDSAVVRPMRAAGINAGYVSPHLVPDGVDPSSMTPFTDQKRMAEQANPQAAPVQVAKATPPVAPPVTPPVAKQEVAAVTPPASVVGGGQGGVAGPSAVTQPAGNVTARKQANGVMEFSGQNVSGDVSYNGGFKPSGAGVSNQNMAAADALAQRYAGLGFTPGSAGAMANTQQGPQNLTPQTSGSGFGILDSGYRDRRAAAMDVQQMKPGAKTAQAALLQRQNAEPGQQIERDKMAADVTSGNADRALRADEISATSGFRSGQLANDAARLNLDTRKTDSDLEARGFEVSQAKRLESIRKKYEAATDPKVKADLAQQLRTLSGDKDQQNRFTVVPGGQEWDAAAGVMRNVPAGVINNQTGEFVGGGPKQQAQGPAIVKNDADFDALPKGATYIGPDGKKYMK